MLYVRWRNEDGAALVRFFSNCPQQRSVHVLRIPWGVRIALTHIDSFKSMRRLTGAIKEVSMATFVVLAGFTDQGIRNVKETVG